MQHVDLEQNKSELHSVSHVVAKTDLVQENTGSILDPSAATYFRITAHFNLSIGKCSKCEQFNMPLGKP